MFLVLRVCDASICLLLPVCRAGLCLASACGCQNLLQLLVSAAPSQPSCAKGHVARVTQNSLLCIQYLTLFVCIYPTVFLVGVSCCPAGLDYAFPEAAKLGGFISAATQSAKRALFCWNAAGRGAQDADDEQADGIVQVGTIQGPVLVERQVGSQGTDKGWCRCVSTTEIRL